MLKECKWCGDTFNPKSKMKQMAGGYANECPTCVEERGGDDAGPGVRKHDPPDRLPTGCSQRQGGFPVGARHCIQCIFCHRYNRWDRDRAQQQ